MFSEVPSVMRHKISSELIEAFSLCPRKAFLLMTGATASPGPHDYEVVIREQAEANRQAHCARLAEGGEVVPFGGLSQFGRRPGDRRRRGSYGRWTPCALRLPD